MPELAGRLYVPKLYRINSSRRPVVQLLERAIEESGGRVVYSSFERERVAPIYIGAEDRDGARYGLLIYPFTATRRQTGGRADEENRAQVRFGDPKRVRGEDNPLATDLAGVDVTLVLTVDPEVGFIVGLDPLVYAELPMGISLYYRDVNVEATQEHGWSVWEREKVRGARRSRVVELETMVGFLPHRLLDYVRFETRATALGLDPSLRGALAEQYRRAPAAQHALEEFFALDSREILDIIQTNFRLGVAVRGGVAERHLASVLADDPAVRSAEPIDEDARPDFKVTTVDGRSLLIECKTASARRFANGDLKVEVQKTRDSGAGRQYTFDQFDVMAACLFSATGLWEYRFRWTRDLEPLGRDRSRIKPIQRIDELWASSLGALLDRQSRPPPAD